MQTETTTPGAKKQKKAGKTDKSRPARKKVTAAKDGSSNSKRSGASSAKKSSVAASSAASTQNKRKKTSSKNARATHEKHSAKNATQDLLESISETQETPSQKQQPHEKNHSQNGKGKLGSLESWPHLSLTLHNFEDNARNSWEHISENLRGKLYDVDGTIKKKPYAYVIGALGVGIAFATVLL